MLKSCGIISYKINLFIVYFVCSSVGGSIKSKFKKFIPLINKLINTDSIFVLKISGIVFSFILLE